jgi:hypothetical protein
MKTSARRIGLFAGFCLATAGISSDAHEMQREPIERSNRSHQQWNDPELFTEPDVADLNKGLDLTPAQQDAWETFSTALMRLKKEAAQLENTGRAVTPTDFEALTTSQKMATLSATMRLNAESLRKTAHIVKDFYAMLSEEQKSNFDLNAGMVWSI